MKQGRMDRMLTRLQRAQELGAGREAAAATRHKQAALNEPAASAPSTSQPSAPNYYIISWTSKHCRSIDRGGSLVTACRIVSLWTRLGTFFQQRASACSTQGSPRAPVTANDLGSKIHDRESRISATGSPHDPGGTRGCEKGATTNRSSHKGNRAWPPWCYICCTSALRETLRRTLLPEAHDVCSCGKSRHVRVRRGEQIG